MKKTIPNFGYFSPQAVSVDVDTIETEVEGKLVDAYAANLILHLEMNEDKDGTYTTTSAIVLETGVVSEDLSDCVNLTLNLATGLFGVDVVSPIIVRDISGEVVREVDLNDLLDSEDEPEQTVH